MNTASACTICSSHSHKTMKCPDLHSDTKEGFYAGASSGCDGEEDSVRCVPVTIQYLDTLEHSFVAIREDQEQGTGNPVQ